MTRAKDPDPADDPRPNAVRTPSERRPDAARTAYLVTLTNGSIAEVQADDLTTRADGALFLMQAIAKPPAALVTVAVFAARQWTSCIPKASTAVTFIESPPAVQVPAPNRTAPEQRFA